MSLILAMLVLSSAPLADSAGPGPRFIVPASLMSQRAVERAVRQGYRYGEKIGGQGERALVRGAHDGLTIKMWVNKTTKTIETAYPVF